ncbi:MAG: DUF4426 domain-containing protein [Gammaproteobacteria bacterium]|nr:DUF4426 domain-containing protein [Gammaproteobacteria bacterium]
MRALMLLLTLMSLAATADTLEFDGRTIHYNLSPTTYLTPEVASTYQIKRSSTRNLISIAVLDGPEHNAPPLAATINGEARNLLSQLQTLTFREVREGNAIYYIATIDFHSEELWRFAIDIQLADGSSKQLRFEKTLYAD